MKSMQLGTIVLATDGSEDARTAERAALDVQRGTGAALHVVHVWRSPTEIYAGATLPLLPISYERFEGGTKAILDAGAEGGQAVLDASAARIAAAGGTLAGRHLLHGPAAELVAALALTLTADLVLIGSRGLGPVRRLVLGSVSEGVIRGAACPVLVLRGAAASWPPARVIVGDDGSASAAAAAESAALVAGAVGAQLTVAQAIPDVPGLPQPETAEGKELLAAAERGLRERAARLPGGVAEQAQFVAALDDPAALLLRLAEAVATPALLAVGSRGLRLFERLWLGSTSTKLAHAAPCPVLVAPQRAE